MEARREAKAQKAANLTASIEAELMTRLKSGTYGDIYNFPMAQYNSVLDKNSVPDKQAIEGQEEEEEDEEEDEELQGNYDSEVRLA